MRVLLTHRPSGAYSYISDGWLNAFADCGIEVQRWDGNTATWERFNPDLYLGVSGHKQPIPNDRGNCKVAIHVNPFGDISVKGIDESTENINWVARQRPNAVFGYGLKQHRPYWSKWESICPWVPMATAGDATIYKAYNSHKTLDYAYVGGRWPYKSSMIDKYLLPLIGKYTGKIYGWGDWPSGSSLGNISDGDVVTLYNQAKFIPCISEPHTHIHGIDLPERVFKAILCGAVAVHDPVSVATCIDSIIYLTDTPAIDDICNNEETRVAIWTKQHNNVLSGHTYHHRLSNLLSVLGFSAESSKLLNRITNEFLDVGAR